MRYSKRFGSYNDRRYSKPWIARVTDWPIGKYPTLEFGNYIGDDSGGEAEITAEPGDLLKAGQKDFRKPRGTENDFYLCEADGTLTELSPSEARKAWEESKEQSTAFAAITGLNMDNPLAGFSNDEILAEAKRRNLI